MCYKCGFPKLGHIIMVLNFTCVCACHPLMTGKAFNCETSFKPQRTEIVSQNVSHFQHWHLCCIYMYFGHHSLSLPHRNPKLRGTMGLHPLRTPINEGTPPLKFPLHSLFRPKGSVNVFSHFHRLMPDNNYKHLKCFVMVGTHSEPHRNQMSHISALRVN